MSNLYECVVIVDPDETDEGVDAVIGQLRDHIQAAGGDVLFVDRWGRRKLAYPIRRKTEGVYSLIYIEGQPDLPRLLRARIRIMESILREMVIRLEDEQEAEIRKRAEELGDEDAHLAEKQRAAAAERARTKADAIAAEKPSGGDPKTEGGTEDELEAGDENDAPAGSDELVEDESALEGELEAGDENGASAVADELAGDESSPEGDEDTSESSTDGGEEA